MTASTFIGHFLGPDTHTNRPAVTGLPNGTQYVCTTHQKIERIVSGAWVDYATLGVPAGSGVVAIDPIFDAKGDLVAGTAADTAAKVTAGTNGQVLTADSAQTTGVKWATPSAGSTGALTLLSTTTLASPGTFDVSGISGAYNDLSLVLIARSAAAVLQDAACLRFNNDAGGNYWDQTVRSEGSTASALESRGSGAAATRAAVTGSTGLTNSFGVVTFTLFGYASTTWLKSGTFEAFELCDTGAVGMRANFGGFFWNSTAAINRVQIVNAQTFGNFVTGSQLRIYGRL